MDLSKYIPFGTYRLIRQEETTKSNVAIIIIIFALSTFSNIDKNNNINWKKFRYKRLSGCAALEIKK